MTWLLTVAMVVIAIQIIIYLVKEHLKEKAAKEGGNNTGNTPVKMQNAAHNDGFFNSRSEARGAADELEFALRLDKTKANSLDAMQMAIVASETGRVFNRDSHIDPIAVEMVLGGLNGNVRMMDGETVLTPEQRMKIARDFTNTHLGKLATFTHAIDRNGKLIISADAIGFITSEYDPILLPGGLISIVVKNEVEASLYKSLLTGSPIYIMNEQTKEVSRLDPEVVKKIVKSGDIDAISEEIREKDEHIATLKADLKAALLNKDKLSDEISHLSDQITSLEDALTRSRHTIANISQSYNDNQHSAPVVVADPAPEIIPEKQPEPTQEEEVKTIQAEAPDMMPIEKPTEPQKQSVVEAFSGSHEPQNQNKQNDPEQTIKISALIDGITKNENAILPIIRNKNEWLKAYIFYIYVERGVARIYFERTMLKRFLQDAGIGIEDDIKWSKILFYDDMEDEGYFASTYSVDINVAPSISGYSENIHPYTLEMAKEYVNSVSALGLSDVDSRCKALAGFISGKRFKSAEEMLR